MKTKARPNEKDKKIGRLIRAKRIENGITQSDLADLLSLTYQQVHKYECGINRVSASRLYDIANVLQTPIQYFYSDVEKAPSGHGRDTMMLMKNYKNIQNERHREALRNLVSALAEIQ